MGSPRGQAFLEVVRKSELVAEDQLRDVIANLGGEEQLPEPNEIAKTLLRAKLVTRFHLEQLLQGKYKGFFLGKYKILDLLGVGGMGRVYLAEHSIMRRQVAIKLLRKSGQSGSAVKRFEREARAIAALSHPNIIHAYDFDSDDDMYFMVMEYVDGVSVLEYVKATGPMPVGLAVEIVCQACDGLEHAWRAGLIHRDIKPGNILIDTNGTVKLLDLGLAVFQEDQDDNKTSLTVAYDENVLGTADYLSPEQAIDSHNVDIRTDIYSLGGTLYFMFAGHPPFPTGSIAQKLLWHQNKAPEPLRNLNPNVPEELADLIDKMMAKKPTERFSTPAETKAALLPFAERMDRPLEHPDIKAFREVRRSSGYKASTDRLAQLSALKSTSLGESTTPGFAATSPVVDPAALTKVKAGDPQMTDRSTRQTLPINQQTKADADRMASKAKHANQPAEAPNDDPFGIQSSKSNPENKSTGTSSAKKLNAKQQSVPPQNNPFAQPTVPAKETSKPAAGQSAAEAADNPFATPAQPVKVQATAQASPKAPQATTTPSKPMPSLEAGDNPFAPKSTPATKPATASNQATADDNPFGKPTPVATTSARSTSPASKPATVSSTTTTVGTAKNRMPMLIAGAVIGLAAIAGSAYWFWPKTPEPDPSASKTPVVSNPDIDPKKGMTETPIKEDSKQPTTEPEPAAIAVLDTADWKSVTINLEAKPAPNTLLDAITKAEPASMLDLNASQVEQGVMRTQPILLSSKTLDKTKLGIKAVGKPLTLRHADEFLEGPLLSLEGRSEILIENVIFDGDGRKGPLLEIIGPRGDGITIRKCQFINFAGDAIRIQNTIAQKIPLLLDQVTIAGGPSSTRGIVIASPPLAENVTDQSRQLRVVGSRLFGPMNVGISLEQTVRGLTIERTIFSQCKTALALQSDQATWRDILVQGNTLHGVDWGITLSSADPKKLNLTVIDNLFADVKQGSIGVSAAAFKPEESLVNLTTNLEANSESAKPIDQMKVHPGIGKGKVEFQSLDKNASNFLRPKPITGTKLTGTRSTYIGAVVPAS